MESSPNQNTVNMDGRIDAALETIDKALIEYDESERLRKAHRAADHLLVLEELSLET